MATVFRDPLITKLPPPSSVVAVGSQAPGSPNVLLGIPLFAPPIQRLIDPVRFTRTSHQAITTQYDSPYLLLYSTSPFFGRSVVEPVRFTADRSTPAITSQPPQRSLSDPEFAAVLDGVRFRVDPWAAIGSQFSQTRALLDTPAATLPPIGSLLDAVRFRADPTAAINSQAPGRKLDDSQAILPPVASLLDPVRFRSDPWAAINAQGWQVRAQPETQTAPFPGQATDPGRFASWPSAAIASQPVRLPGLYPEVPLPPIGTLADGVRFRTDTRAAVTSQLMGSPATLQLPVPTPPFFGHLTEGIRYMPQRMGDYSIAYSTLNVPGIPIVSLYAEYLYYARRRGRR